MNTFQENMNEFRLMLKEGTVQKAYLGLMQYMMTLRTTFEKKYPAHAVTGLYQGYMDMTYFSFTPESLQARRLKVAIVFVYEKFRFEIWLAAANKQIQASYWEIFKLSEEKMYQLVPEIKGYDSILEHVLVEIPDFSNLNALTEQIESEALGFIRGVDDYLKLVESHTKE